MKILLIVSTIVVPIIMLIIVRKNTKFNLLFNSLAILALLIFSGITSTSIYQMIVDNEVFMTTIHGLFLNKVFLVVGAYIGVFVIFRLMKLTLEERE